MSRWIEGPRWNRQIKPRRRFPRHLQRFFPRVEWRWWR